MSWYFSISEHLPPDLSLDGLRHDVSHKVLERPDPSGQWGMNVFAKPMH